MNFWNKNGTRNQEEEISSSSKLLDVSAIDIPDSDQNDQYGENVFAKASEEIDSFSLEEEESFAPTIDHPAAPFMAPPIPTEQVQEFQSSSVNMALDEYDDLPPLENEETETEFKEEVEENLPSPQEDIETKEEVEVEGTKMVSGNAYPDGIVPMAQAPRSKTFVKQAEPEIKVEKKEESEQEKKEEKAVSEDLEYIHYSNPLFLKKLFANGNTCITAPGAAFQLKDDMRSLLALFSNGRYFVAETYKYDGKVLSFEYLVKKRNLQIGKPEYVPMTVLSTIYEYAAQNTYAEDTDEVTEKPDVVEQAQARMQRDFITIISRAAAMHVSDIHIVVAENTIVMFRVNGLMQTEMEYKKEWGESFVRAAFASADISDANYAQNEYQAAQKLGRTPLRGSHGKLILPRNILGVRLQFNPIAFGTRYVVLRLLYAEESMESSSALEALGFTKKDTEDFYKLRGEPTGITIISGPTGSGKSTTLQRNMIAMLQERNYEVNLITVEDPPEYPIPGARQMPVTNATIEEAKEREFTKALAAALRSDPDSMMIGEVRTLSAADLAFRAALSGHNVWTTLHANNAPSILIRLKDMGVEEFKLKDPEIIKGLTAQRLFRRLCPHCRVPATERLSLPIIERLRTGFGDVALETTYLRGPGCKHCDFKGVKGRIAVSEIILPDTTFLELMLKGDTVKATNYWINELNGTTLRESALRHMFNGIIDIGEVERWTGFLDQTITG
ncbi:MAG: Flp pilus assembly complex ATPase component TadA [Alphaproteobacteria bacterium]|nr:Flp pilus assembly complex ATPase component TadA [Alphaproteobacteria bacterium]